MKRYCKLDDIYFSPPRFCPDGQLIISTVFQIDIPPIKQHICKPHQPSHKPKFAKELFSLSPTKIHKYYSVITFQPKTNFP